MPKVSDGLEPPALSGHLRLVGSASLAQPMVLWAEAFHQRYPDLQVQVQAAGSATTPAALIESTAQLGAMSRLMREDEVDAFVQRHGYPPTEWIVAQDELALFVHQDNPLASLSRLQLDALFSAVGLCGGRSAALRWRDLGVEGPLAAQRVRLYGRNSASGSQSFFKQHALCGGDFRVDVQELPSSTAILRALEQDPRGLGYASATRLPSGVREVPLETGRFVRYLYFYLHQVPGQPLPPREAAFLAFVLSDQGQALLLDAGYLPLSEGHLAQARARLVAQ